MKKNLSLLGLFILLLGLTYIFQEKRAEREYNEAQTRDRLVTTDITHVKLPGADAVKKNGSWWSGDRLLSHNTFKIIEKKLTEIKKIKSIKGDWNSFFPHPFNFEINHVPWTIGDMSLDRQGFYIAEGKNIYLAFIEGESTELTQDEKDIEAIKLNELVSALSKPAEEFKENQLFRFYPDIPLERIVISVEGNLPFELNLEKDTTLPPPIKGVAVHKDLRGKFYSLLTQMNLKEEIPYSEKLKFKQLGEVKFLSSKKIVTWQLWIRSDKSADAIIIDPVLKRSFLMIGGTLRLFFVRYQDYWDKKVIPTESFKQFTRLSTTFTQGTKSAVVTILNHEPLSFEVKGYKVEQLRMEQLIQFIFNLGPKDQADRVSLLSSTERKQILSKEHLRIDIFRQELLLWRKKEELIVVNLTQGFKAHFNLVDENFHGTFEDVLK
jgi:hypothetical protein